MVGTKSKLFTFSDYVAYDDGTDARYELVKGQLVAMTPPTWQHLLIARCLERLFEAEIQRSQLDWIALQGGRSTGGGRYRSTPRCDGNAGR